MTSVVELFPKARKLAYELQNQCRQVELGCNQPDNVYMGITELSRQLEILQSLVGQERPHQRDIWRRKIAELGNDKDFVKSSLDRYVQRHGKNYAEQKEREELMRRRHQNMPSIVIDQV